MLPLVLIAAIAAAHGARAQAGDRYGPGAAPADALRALRPAAALAVSTPAVSGPVPGPALRRLTWPGKAELRPALAPASYVAPAPTPPPAWTPPAPAAAPAATARFPGMAVYGARPPPPPAPALRGAHPPTYADANTPFASSTWSPATARARTRGASTPLPRATPLQMMADAPAAPPAPSPAPRPPRAVAPPPAGAQPSAAPSTLAPAFPRAATLTPADALPAPALGRYGYVGPGRDAPPATPVPVAKAPAASSAPSDGSGALGAPRPPAYARAYVLPAAATAPASASTLPPPPVAAARPTDGVRRYSVHREFGEEPDPIRLSPQTLSAAPDLSAPETPEVAPRTGAAAGKAQVNAARLAAASPG